jgi:galactokinase
VGRTGRSPAIGDSKARRSGIETAVRELRRVVKTEDHGSDGSRGRADRTSEDMELSRVRAELTAERQNRTQVDRLCKELWRAQADVKSLRCRNGILRSDVDEARQNEKRMSDAFEVIKAELDESKERWKEV